MTQFDRIRFPLWCKYSFLMTFPYSRVINVPIHTAKMIQKWFDEHQDEVKCLQLPLQSPIINF